MKVLEKKNILNYNYANQLKTTKNTFFPQKKAYSPHHTNDVFIQPKLKVSEPNDKYEKEADRVADEVMRMKDHEVLQRKPSAINIQRKCDECEEEKNKNQRKEGAGKVSPYANSLVNEVIKSPGKPLDIETRAFMEPRFGYDFSKVSIHDDNKAAESASAVNAIAYTVGNNIVLNRAEFPSATKRRKYLVAHELAHVIQQRDHSSPQAASKQGHLELGTIKVALHYANTREVRWLYWNMGIRIPGSPPDVKWGKDGSIPDKYRKIVQFAYDIVYRIINAADFAARLSALKKRLGKVPEKVPEITNLTTSRIIGAVRKMVLHLADTSKDVEVSNLVQEDRAISEDRQTAGMVKMGTNNVYIMKFAIQQGADTLASLILHESFHVAGVTMGGALQLYDLILHGFEAEAGLPNNMGGGEIKPIIPQPQGFSWIRIRYKLWKIGGDMDLPEDMKLEILNDERRIIFQKKIARSPGSYSILWNGKELNGKQVSWGLYTVRIVSPVLLHGSTILEIKRY